MMTIARAPHHFYTVFEVNPDTYDDIRQRLDESGALWKQKMSDDDGEEIGEIPYDESQEFFEGVDICQDVAAELDIPRSYIEIRA